MKWVLPSLWMVLILCPGAISAQSPSPAASNCDAVLADAKTVESEEITQRLLDCGTQLFLREEHTTAQIYFERARQIAVKRGDQPRVAAALWRYGEILIRQGKGDPAEPMLNESLRVRRELNDKLGQAQTLTTLGGLWNLRGDYQKMRECHLECLRISREAGLRDGVAFALNNIGASYDQQGDYLPALDFYQQALAALAELNDKRRSVRVMQSVGQIHAAFGDWDQALSLYNRALVLAEEFNDRFRLGGLLRAIGDAHLSRGSYGEALAAYQKSTDLRATIGVASVHESMHGVALAYKAQGSFALAVESLQKGLELARKLKISRFEVSTLCELSDLYLAEGKIEQALGPVQHAVELTRTNDQKREAPRALNVLGRVRLAQRRWDLAAEALEESIRISDSMLDRVASADTLASLAEVRNAQLQPAKALELALRSAQTAESSDLPDVHWRALTQAGRAHKALGHPNEALSSFEAAVKVVEQLRNRVAGPEEVRTSFLADRMAPFHELLDLTLRDPQSKESLYVAERSKARTLLDVVGKGRIPVAKAETPEERRQESQLRNALTSLNLQLQMASAVTAPDVQGVARLRSRREAARLEFERFQTSLYVRHPELRMQRADVPALHVAEVQGMLRPSGRSNSIAIEFLIAGDQVWAFAVTSAGFNAHRLKISKAALTSMVGEFRKQLAERDLEAPATAERLFGVVLGPLRTMLAGKTEVILAPDGILWDLPFQALRKTSGRYLVEDHAISYTPSFTVLREIRNHLSPDAKRKKQGVLVVGNGAAGTGEPVPEAERQAKMVSDFYGSRARLLLGSEATEARVREEARHFRVVHLAAHGVLDNRNPLYSHVVLAGKADGRDDGLLEAREILELSLGADLVVLSACETARGRISAGEGVLGLTWSLFASGVQAALVSQWRVDSASSTALMYDFHRRWNGGASRVSKSEALRQASLTLMRSAEYSHPYYWAGFIVAGDAR